MSDPMVILEAISKHDAAAAQVLAADCYGQLLSESNDVVRGVLAPALVSRLEEHRPRIIQDIAKSYVSNRMNGDTFLDSSAIDDLDELVEVVKTSSTQHMWGGRSRRVNRDESGKFAAKPGTNTSDAGNWTNAEGKQNTVPNEVKPELFGPNNNHNNGIIDSGTSAQRKKDVEAYLGRVKEVRAVMRDLKKTFKNDKDIILEVEFGEGVRNVEFNASQKIEDVSWDLGNAAPKNYLLSSRGDKTNDETTQKLGKIAGLNTKGSMTADEVRDMVLQISEVKDDKKIDEKSGLDKVRSLTGAAATLAHRFGMPQVGAGLTSANVGMAALEDFRPQLARAAYRYRGTERVPEDNMVAAATLAIPEGTGMASENAIIDGMIRYPLKDVPNEVQGTLLASRRASDTGDYADSPTALLMGNLIESYQTNPVDKKISNQRLIMGLQRDLVAQQFLKKQVQSAITGSSEIGSKAQGVASGDELVRQIANKIGRGIPSEGLMIDDRGSVVTQSVGMGGDHYQPFTLEALGKLDGGQYIRSRAAGGITVDDVRTLLFSGGRAATVVSAGGVFDLEFDPRFRENKRYSDKAVGMIETYERILDQLSQKKIYSVDLPVEVETKIAETAAQRSRALPGSDEYQTVYDALQDKERARLSRISVAEHKEMKANAEIEAKKTSEDPEDLYRQKVAEKQKNKVRQLSLNGEGYAVAMRTLQKYYPYWIRTASRRDTSSIAVGSNFSEGARQMLTRYESNMKDSEYVKPGNARMGSGAAAASGRPKRMGDTAWTNEADANKKKEATTAATTGGAGAVPKATGDGAKKAEGSTSTSTPGSGSGEAGAIPDAGDSTPVLLKSMNSMSDADVNKLTSSFVGSSNGLTDTNDTPEYQMEVETLKAPLLEEGLHTFNDSQDVVKALLVRAMDDPNTITELVNAYKKDGEKLDDKIKLAIGSVPASGPLSILPMRMESVREFASTIANLNTKWAAESDGFDGRPQVSDEISDINGFTESQDPNEITPADVLSGDRGTAASELLPYEGAAGDMRDDDSLYDMSREVSDLYTLSENATAKRDAILASNDSELLSLIASSKASLMFKRVSEGMTVEDKRGLLADSDQLKLMADAAKYLYSIRHLDRTTGVIRKIGKDMMSDEHPGRADPKALAPLGLTEEQVSKSARSPMSKSLQSQQELFLSVMRKSEPPQGPQNPELLVGSVAKSHQISRGGTALSVPNETLTRWLESQRPRTSSGNW